MQRKLLAVFASLWFVSTVHAQRPDNYEPPPPHLFFHGICNGSAIAGVPFSGSWLYEDRQQKHDGSTDLRYRMILGDRDSRGRIRWEWYLLSADRKAVPLLRFVCLYDPETRLNTVYSSNSHIARQSVLPEPKHTHNGAKPRANEKVEDLGTTTLNGLDAKGVRSTFDVKPKLSEGEASAEVVDEYWYSEDLRIYLLSHRTDSRKRVHDFALTEIKREGPLPEVFDLPEDYKILNVKPPSKPPAELSRLDAGGPTW